jgi:hypothetical protein
MTGGYCLVHLLGARNSFIGPQVSMHTQAKLTAPVVLTNTSASSHQRRRQRLTAGHRFVLAGQ